MNDSKSKALSNTKKGIKSTTEMGEASYWKRKDKDFGGDKRKFLSGNKKEHARVASSLHKKLKGTKYE